MTTLHSTAPNAGFRHLPFMGVIRVNDEAMRLHGYRMGDPSWSNLGQGQPEVGVIPGAPARFDSLKIDLADHAYGPVEGLTELRARIAEHYNRLYRRGQASQYTIENVAVASGGRLALSRCATALNAQRLGYFTPDYTAYEDLLTTFPRIEPVWIQLREENGYRIDPAELRERVDDESLDALLISNPCNPTGVVIAGDDLRAWVLLSRERGATLLFDEFYSHYVYKDSLPLLEGEGQGGGERVRSSHSSTHRPVRSHPSIGSQPVRSVSAAEFVEDVNEDRVILFDGLTKCFRYPGWRIGWVVGPRDVIRTLTAAGSFLDGGASRPIQRAAIEVLEPSRADQETNAVRAHFAEKQQITVEMLSAAGVRFPVMEQSKNGQLTGTFYAWGSVADLPPPLDTGLGFMRAAFKHRVLTVPGEYFDVNPHRQRVGDSYLNGFVRFSFGPPKDNLIAGLERLTEMIAAHR
jgi:aspartate/methionine/tyrosine aminotransferase